MEVLLDNMNVIHVNILPVDAVPGRDNLVSHSWTCARIARMGWMMQESGEFDELLYHICRLRGKKDSFKRMDVKDPKM
jgi:hypothetical protein